MRTCRVKIWKFLQCGSWNLLYTNLLCSKRISAWLRKLVKQSNSRNDKHLKIINRIMSHVPRRKSSHHALSGRWLLKNYIFGVSLIALGSSDVWRGGITAEMVSRFWSACRITVIKKIAFVKRASRNFSSSLQLTGERQVEFECVSNCTSLLM